MAEVLDLPADVYYGHPDDALPDWRAYTPVEDDTDDEAEPSEDDKAAVRLVLGFDPAELDDDGPSEAAAGRQDYAKEFKEFEHPRDDDGKFADGGGGTATKKKVKSKAKLAGFIKADDEHFRKALQNILGPHAQPEDVASVVGAPDDATFEVREVRDDSAIRVKIKDHVFAQRTIHKEPDGTIWIQNEVIEIDEHSQGKGLGSQIFARQVEQARELGVAYIECQAARGEDWNGYYTWPRMGYDQPLNELDWLDVNASLENVRYSFQRHLFMAVDREGGTEWFSSRSEAELWLQNRTYFKIRDKFPDAKTVLDIMATKEGRDWWKENGREMPNARFDLSDGSRSMQIHEAYLEERAKRGV